MPIIPPTTPTTVLTSADTWVNDIIAQINTSTGGVLQIKVGGQTIGAQLGVAAITFFVTNQALLLRIGKETFTDFLILISEKKQEEAFALLLNQMNADEIISRMNSDASELQQATTDHEAFIAATENFVFNVLTGLALKVLIGVLTGGAGIVL